MKKPIVWSQRSLNDLKKAYDFYTDNFNEGLAYNIVQNILSRVSLLETDNFDYSNIGAIDEAFSHLKYSYRKLIEGHYKITYRVGKTKIFIVRVFDTRQNPNKNK